MVLLSCAAGLWALLAPPDPAKPCQAHVALISWEMGTASSDLGSGGEPTGHVLQWAVITETSQRFTALQRFPGSRIENVLFRVLRKTVNFKQ